MLQIKNYFSYKKSIKISTVRFVLNSFLETNQLRSFNNIVTQFENIEHHYFGNFFLIKEKREVANCVFKDMLKLICM